MTMYFTVGAPCLVQIGADHIAWIGLFRTFGYTNACSISTIRLTYFTCTTMNLRTWINYIRWRDGQIHLSLIRMLCIFLECISSDLEVESYFRREHFRHILLEIRQLFGRRAHFPVHCLHWLHLVLSRVTYHHWPSHLSHPLPKFVRWPPHEHLIPIVDEKNRNETNTFEEITVVKKCKPRQIRHSADDLLYTYISSDDG